MIGEGGASGILGEIVGFEQFNRTAQELGGFAGFGEVIWLVGLPCPLK